MSSPSNLVLTKLQYYQEILQLNIQASEQFDLKLLNYPSYYTYNPDKSEFLIDLNNTNGSKFVEKIKKLALDESIAITIRYTINGTHYPILIAYVTDDNLDNGNLSVNANWFKFHSPTLESLGYENEEVQGLNAELIDLKIADKIKYVTDEITSRYENATIISGQFLSGVVNITSFEKIIKEKIDSFVNTSAKIREHDIMYKYLEGDLNSIAPTLKAIIPIQTNLNIDQQDAVEAFYGTRLQTLNGPPGTGKSQTITEFLLQSILNDKKVLLTSYNNKPVDVVYKKIQKELGIAIPFPCYGSDIQAIFREYVEYIHSLRTYTTKLKLTKKLKQLDHEYEVIIEKYDPIDTYIKTDIRLKYLEQKYMTILTGQEEDKYDLKLEYHNKKKYLVENKKEYTKLLTEQQSKKTEYSDLQKELIICKLNLNLIDIYDRDLEVLEDAMSNTNRIYQARKVLEDLMDNSPIVFGNILKSINNLPSKKNYFDYILVDEASQCNQLAIVPLLYITRALIAIGDPKQLSHIPGNGITEKSHNKLLKKYKKNNKDYNYVQSSLFDYVNSIRISSNQKELFLSYHYRCSPDIIEFSNVNYYNNRLKVQTVGNNKSVNWHHIEGQANNNNFNPVEVNMVLNRVIHYAQLFKQQDIGVISQYRNQTNRIRRILQDNGYNQVTVGTIHTFQGDEKKVILYSPVYSNGSNKKSMDFINISQTNILNVAISRGQEVFEVVGDKNYALNIHNQEGSLYEKLARFIENKHLTNP
jgi:superfamily I DNA and/or RNA helicase